MISVEHLTKYYGDYLAVDDISFEIDEGHVYGFLGPNGAGKSTTMNIITGCISASSGSVKIDGYDIFSEPCKAKKVIGYLPELPPLYLNDTPYEYLKFVGEAKGLRGKELRSQIQRVCEMTKITDVVERKIGNLSKGYRQRVGIAQALLGSPKVIILDEPTVGLDPNQIIEIRELISELGKDHTVILSSHILSEVQAMCDEIIIISEGHLLAFDKPENLENALCGNNEIKILTNASESETKDIVSGIEEISDCSFSESNDYVSAVLKINCKDVYHVSEQLFRKFADRGFVLYELSVKKASLEDVFIELTKNSGSEAVFEKSSAEDTDIEEKETN